MPCVRGIARAQRTSFSPRNSTEIKEEEVEKIGAPEHVDQHTRVIDVESFRSLLRRLDLVNADLPRSRRHSWRTDMDAFSPFPLFIYLFRRTQQAHNSASIRDVARAKRARARQRYIYRYVSSSIAVVDCRSLQPRRPSETAGAGDPRRVCHCTGTITPRRRVTSIRRLLLGRGRTFYTQLRIATRENEKKRTAGRRSLSLSSRVRVSLCLAVPRRRGSFALTGWSMRAPRRWQRRRYDGECPFYEEAAHSTIRASPRNREPMIIIPAANLRSFSRARCQQSRARRRSDPSSRSVEEEEIERPFDRLFIAAFDVTRDRG